MDQPQVVTDLAENPDEDHRRRVFQYTLAMSIRVVCVLACIWVRGWWLLIPAIGAITLPYVAVVLANAASRRRGRRETVEVLPFEVGTGETIRLELPAAPVDARPTDPADPTPPRP